MRASIRNQTLTLEARIAAAEVRTTGHELSDQTLEAFNHAGRVFACFARAGSLPEPEGLLRCLLESGVREDDAARYARMAFHEVRDEIMSNPALDLFA
jgi:hypothetical protein